MLARKRAAAPRCYDGKDWRGTSRGFGLAFGIEGFGDDFAVGFAEKDFNFAFGFLELLLAFAGKSDAFFEEFHGVVERELRTFEFADDFLEAREAALEVGLFGGIGFFGGGSIHVVCREQFTAGWRGETSCGWEVVEMFVIRL